MLGMKRVAIKAIAAAQKVVKKRIFFLLAKRNRKSKTLLGLVVLIVR
ncbi:hypothetical protein GPEL0_01r0904 [Geoanaerobacter pelophilus]|uniref:Uncharacterized protein n=1 Tax=Geoanaerobacter pelophilus TaxID=60036 RepID=A0ABQ0MGF8_9BACT|nr:hypothetical protein GPEL0_01r0904 [Geoanaerobacter pelophilus]